MAIIITLLILLSIALICFTLRKPKLEFFYSNKHIISPAYGTINKILKSDTHICISIFLTIKDVHYQYIPYDGIITNIKHDYNGQFNIVYKDHEKSKDNEKVIYELTTDMGTIIIYQIAGKVFRRIYPFVKEEQEVFQGDTLGLISFGSRVDICIPIMDKKINILVKEGQYVNGGDDLVEIMPI